MSSAQIARQLGLPQADRLDRVAVALVLLLCALWGVQQVAVKVAVAQGLPPALQVGLRSAIAAALLCVWVGLRQGGPGLRGLLAVDRSWRPGLAIGVIFAVEFLLVYVGLTRTTASRAVLFFYTAPFFVALGAHWLIPAERMRARQAAGLACAFVGVALAMLGRDGASGLGGAPGGGAGGTGVAGDAMTTLGAALWAANTLIVKADPRMRGVTPAKALLYQLGISAPIMLAASVALGEWKLASAPTLLAWALLAWQGSIVAFASYLLWFWLIARYPAGKLSAFTFLTPLFGLAAGVTLLGEPASPVLLAALALVAAGLVLVNGGR